MQLAVIGLSTMGGNIARNAARNGARVPVFNRTTERTEQFIADHGTEGEFVLCRTYEELIASMAFPRAILIMVKAGKPVDDVIHELLPLLAEGDILIDGGNSLYTDTARRYEELKAKGIRFLGMGVSGGEEGALHGPSMMPGGDESAWTELKPLLEKMAATDGAGKTCVSFMGPAGAGHFVKMVHNGIEYGIMQLIAEAYDVMRTAGRASNEQLSEIFGEWSKGDDLGSFLTEITAQVFRRKEGSGYLLDLIVDRAGQKGTGKWTTEAAMTLGVPIPTINAAVDARIISGDTALREVGRKYPGEPLELTADPQEVVQWSRSALELGTMTAYGQGFALLSTASKEYGWNLPMAEIARIWRGGCIIRSTMLPVFQAAMQDGNDKALIDRWTGKRQQNLRKFVTIAVAQGIPVPSTYASLSYLDTMRKEKLPHNLIQAQRDLFGAHTFARTDREGMHHAEWN